MLLQIVLLTITLNSFINCFEINHFLTLYLYFITVFWILKTASFEVLNVKVLAGYDKFYFG